MDQETLEILAGLNAAQPSTQQVDYSGFMQDFQPVLNQPNYFVPQQGLLQNTPTLDTLSDLDVMQQRPQVVTNMLDQYPTLESDFQRSFAVSPDTFNMNVYQPLPYDADYWNSFVNQGGGTSSSGVDLGSVIGGGLLASKLLGGDGDDGSGSSTGSGVDTSGITNVTTTLNNNDTIDGGIGTQTVEVTPTVETGILTNTILDNDTTEDGIGTQTEEISPTGNNLLASTIIGGAGNDIIDGGIGSQTEETSGNITKNDALGVIQTLTNDNIITSDQSASLTDTIEKTNANFNSALVSGLSQISSIGNNANSVLNSTLTKLSGTSSIPTGGGSTFVLPIESQGKFPVDKISNLKFNTNLRNAQSIIDAANQQLSNFSQVGLLGDVNNYAYDTVAKEWISKIDYDAIANPLKEQIANANTTIQNAIGIETVGEPQGFLDKTFDRIGQGFQDFLNNPISDNIPITGDQVLTGVGTALALDQVIKDAKPSNVTAAIAGGARLAGYTNPYTAPLIAGLTIAEGLAPDPSNKTGFGGYDLATSTNEGFGMEGDKFKQGNVDKAAAISQGMGTAINTIADGFGLKTEGDILVQTGNRDPLSVTYGNQETEQTATNRLNYNPETGDILNSTDDIQRFYYTGQDGFDANMLTNDLVRGTTLLAFKAVANDEDTIDISNLSKVAQSPDTYKNSLLAQGYTEQGADTILNIAQVGGVDTMGLLGDRAVVATNENQYLTQEEIASLLEKGYTEEQIAQYT